MLTSIEEIECWLNEMNVKCYHINEDLTVDVKGSVNLKDKKLKLLPIQFGKVSEDFYCHENQLSSLKGCPIYVGRNFWCRKNYLTTLKYAPKEIHGDFDCGNNQIISLKHMPSYIEGSIYLSVNKLSSLKGMPLKVNGDFSCGFNKLISLKHGPKIINGYFSFMNNTIKETIDWTTYFVEDFVTYSPINYEHQELTGFENYYFDKNENKIKFDFSEFIEYQNKLELAKKIEKELPLQANQNKHKI